MRFDLEIEVAAPPALVWDVVLDPARLAHCIPGVQDVTVVEEWKRYTARIVQRVGPFRVALDLDIAMEQAEKPSFVRAQITGKDRLLGSALKQTVEVRLRDAEGRGTHMAVSAELSLLGKLGSMGYGVIRSKANELMTTFAANLKREVEGTEARGHGSV